MSRKKDKPLPDLPHSDWVAPHDFPDLSNAKMVAIDLETKDPDLKKKGPGVRRGDGHIAGLAIATGPLDGEQWYFPCGHETGNKFAPEVVLKWARDNLCNAQQPKIGANLLYDLDWLYGNDVPVKGDFIDVLVAEPLIDENVFSYSLESLGQKYLGEGKEGDEMYEYCAAAFGGKPTRQAQAGNIWRTPPEFVGPYAESDVRLPFQVYEKQKKVIESEALDRVFDIETRLIPLLLAMRQRGVRVDSSKAHDLDRALMKRAKTLRETLERKGVDAWAAASIEKYCIENQIKYNKTPKGNPSFQKAWLDGHTEEVLKMVGEVRRLEKHAGTFIEGTVLGNAINDRVHCQFNQLKSDTFGTVSGRFSSSYPNLQNLPARDGELGPEIRSLFIPEEGETWFCDDWSQIEFRLLVHYAVITNIHASAHGVAAQYREQPSTDFHEYCAKLTGIDRKPAKNINFGLVYGMGEKTMAANLGRKLEDVQEMFDTYHAELPFIKRLYREVSRIASKRGHIHTFLGRRRRFNMWQPRDFEKSRKTKPIGDRDLAVQQWGVISRSGTHKGLNSLLQGGAADIMKVAMVKIWESGICDVLGAPLSTVHDELNWSVGDTKAHKEAHEEALNIMRNCVELEVPLLVDSESGPNWGYVK